MYLWKPKDMEDFYNDKPLFFAHRGYLIKNPENTLSSFNAAINKGARAIEVDVIMTKDNQIICSHNYDMSIETELQEDASKIEYSKIQKANILTNNKEEKEYIPKLTDVLKLIPDETKVLIASSGFSTIGSPAKLKLVLITAPNPVINFISFNNLNNFKLDFLLTVCSLAVPSTFTAWDNNFDFVLI